MRTRAGISISQAGEAKLYTEKKWLIIVVRSMTDKPSFPKISLKYPTLDAFARAAKRHFEKGRLTVKLKREFDSNQRLLLVFQIGDREQPVEIIGQVIDRAAAKEGQGSNYGIRFLNFSEKKLNRILAGESPTDAGASTGEQKAVSAQQEAGAAADKTEEPAKEQGEAAGSEIAAPITERAQSQQETAGPKDVSKPALRFKPAQPSPEIEEPGDASAECVEEEVIVQSGVKQAFDGRAEVVQEQPGTEPEPAAPEAFEAREETGTEDEHPSPAPEPMPFEPVPEKRNELGGQPAPAPEQELSAQEKIEGPEEKIFEVPAELVSEPELKPAALNAGSASKATAMAAEGKGVEEYFEAPAELEPGPGIKIQPSEPSLVAAPRAASPAGPAMPEELPELVESGASKPGKRAEPVQKPVSAPEVPRPSAELKQVLPKALTDFFFRFCKMILNPPDPKLPDSTKNFVSLFEDFQKIMKSRDRVAVYLMLTQSGKDFVIEGIQNLPKSIRVLLPPDLSGTLIFKMIELFDQKELVGIIFRKFIDLEKFQNLILSLGQFNPEKETADALALRLIYMGVYHFSLIFETDLVAVPEKIDEETKIILARFSGELKRLKSLAQQVSEEPRALLTLRLEDILKFVNSPAVIAQMLEHLPLAWTGQIEEFDYQEFEDQLLFSISIPLLVGTIEIFAKKLAELEKRSGVQAKEKKKAGARVSRLLKRVMGRIAYEEPEQALEPLSQLFSRKILKYEELPAEVRDQIAASMLAKNFLAAAEKKLKELDMIKEPKLYAEAASQAIWAAVALIQEHQISRAQQIFQKLVAHYQDKQPLFPDRPKLARETLKKLSDPTPIEILIRLLERGGKEEKELSAAMLYAAGEVAARRLLDAIETSEDRNVRRMICEILARLGDKIAGMLIEEINKPDIPWYLARNMLMILAEMKSALAKSRGQELLKHSDPRVREEAVNYLAVIGGNEAEQPLAASLKDPALAVKRRALICLSRLEQVSDNTVNLVFSLVKEPPEAGNNLAAEPYFQQAIEFLVRSRVDKFFDGTELNGFLRELLERSEKGLFTRAKFNLSPKMKIALIEGLAKRKAQGARKLLSRLAKDKDAQIKRAAEKAIQELGPGQD